MTTASSAVLMGVGMLCIIAAVLSVLGHGITSRSPRFEPFILLAIGAAFVATGFYLLET